MTSRRENGKSVIIRAIGATAPTTRRLEFFLCSITATHSFKQRLVFLQARQMPPTRTGLNSSIPCIEPAISIAIGNYIVIAIRAVRMGIIQILRHPSLRTNRDSLVNLSITIIKHGAGRHINRSRGTRFRGRQRNFITLQRRPGFEIAFHLCHVVGTGRKSCEGQCRPYRNSAGWQKFPNKIFHLSTPRTRNLRRHRWHRQPQGRRQCCGVSVRPRHRHDTAGTLQPSSKISQTHPSPGYSR